MLTAGSHVLTWLLSSRAMPDAPSFQHRLGQRIQAMRQRRGLTQEQLARDCGLSQKYLSELERGEKSASLETLVALAHDGFRTRVAALFVTLDDDVDAEVRRLDEVFAGWPSAARDRAVDSCEPVR